MIKNDIKVVLVSSDDVHGGAAMSCFRVLNALNKIGYPAKLLVQRKKSNSKLVVTTSNSQIKSHYNFFLFALERLVYYPLMKSREVLFSFTLGLTGEKIHKRKQIKAADLINLHWINNSFLSIRSIYKLLLLNKKMVWTLHDMWAFTGGCHYVGECENFQINCGNCPFLKYPSKKDLSYRIYRKKLKLLFENNQQNIVFVASSDWLKGVALKSALLKGYQIESIPTPVDTTIFKPLDQSLIREKLDLDNGRLYVLFAAMNINDPRKGIAYFIEALHILKATDPKLAEKIDLVVFGKSNETVINQMPFPVKNFHFVSAQEKIVQIFNAVDCFVIPSLEDNLPNIIMESMACTTPVVGFNAGGIPQMIDHKINGYVAEFRSAGDLANGILWVLENNMNNALGGAAREKVLREFSEEVVAAKYINLYQNILNETSS